MLAPSVLAAPSRWSRRCAATAGSTACTCSGSTARSSASSAQAWAARTRPCAARGDNPSLSMLRERATSACT